MKVWSRWSRIAGANPGIPGGKPQLSSPIPTPSSTRWWASDAWPWGVGGPGKTVTRQSEQSKISKYAKS
eukprot:2012604-Pyramimonas_sp.AAC.1